MANTANIIAVFTGTTTASEQDFSAAVFTWDEASTPVASTPTAALSTTLVSRPSNISTGSNTRFVVSTVLPPSIAVATQTGLSQSYSPKIGKPASRRQSPQFYIPLIVLSSVIIVGALLVGWFAWRRYCQRHRRRCESRSERVEIFCSKSYPLFQKCGGNRSTTSDMTGPTLVPGTCHGSAVSMCPVDTHRRLGSVEKKSALASFRPSPI